METDRLRTIIGKCYIENCLNALQTIEKRVIEMRAEKKT